MTWIFVDDLADDAGSFADKLGRGSHPIAVDVLRPREARDRLLTDRHAPEGVLMDVDLSFAEGEQGSGPGIAQDIRVKQKAGEIGEYPIVRFSRREPIRKNVKGDPASDDLFDLKIQKEEVPSDITAVQMRLIGLSKVYAQLAANKPPKRDALPDLFGLSQEQLAQWSHSGLHDRLLSALEISIHVAASTFMRGFITPTGLLIGEQVLSFRMGIDIAASGEAWPRLRDSLPFRYSGIAYEEFPRWWARGLDDWWFELSGGDCSLAAVPIAQRHEVLTNKTEISDLGPLVMPSGSAGDKPWRACALTLEEDPLEFIPIDPAEAVRLTPRDDLPVWVDPLYAALGPARQVKDFRLNAVDIDRLARKYK